MIRTKNIALAIIVLVITAPSAFSEDRRSVEFMLPGCQFEAFRPAPVQDNQWSQAFSCRDALAVAVKNGPTQPAFLAACVPEDTSPHDLARMVVEFLEKSPERYKERFDIRAAAALHSVWPCH